ncbi:MAG: fibronectin type III domain-containing protein [Saprospiraceae bacterium]
MRNSMFFFALCIPVLFAFTTAQTSSSNNACPAPENVTIVNKTSNSATFSWDDCGCGGEYHIYHTKDGITSQVYETSSPGININGLSTGTYQFYFYTECSEGTSSIIIEVVVIG